MSSILRHLVVVLMVGLLPAGVRAGARGADVNEIAESYVRLALTLGLYDADYVDAYFGPAEWRPSDADRQKPFPAERLGATADTLLGQLKAAGRRRLPKEELRRHAYLEEQLLAVRAKIDLLAGAKMSFDEESKALYGVIAPSYEETHFQDILRQLDEILPEEGSVYSRFNSYRIRFTVPADKLETALRTTIAEYRRRTVEHLTLPADEGFEMRFVTGKPWGAAVTYQGAERSLVEINSAAPFCVADVLKIAGHEIYPGHHVHLSSLDRSLVRDKGWVEHSILLLHSPLALISEGFAEYGMRDLVMPRDERVEFHRKVLFPLLGIDPAEAERYGRVMELKDELDAAMVEAARRYLGGRLDRDQTRVWLCRYCLITPSAAENLITFIERYRSYMVTYTVGYRLIADYMDRQVGPDADAARRWQLFRTLVSTPRTPSALAAAR